MNTFIYFAYGSNMLLGRLRQSDRAPSARELGIAKLRGFRLTFDKVSKDGSGKCDAEKTGDENDLVYGVLYEIPESEREALDGAEGCGHGYKKELVTVEFEGGSRKAWAYLATKKNSALRPYEWYKSWVLEGAKHHKFPQWCVEVIERVDCIVDDDLETVARETEALKEALGDNNAQEFR